MEINKTAFNNKYFGKHFSILGDSISTLGGYNPQGYNVFYKGFNCEKAGVKQMSDTWWGKVIAFFGGELLVNNSWSGSRVTKLPGNDFLFPSGCSDERTATLHINSIMPDVIIVYLGTNDWAYGVKTGNDTRILGEDYNELFYEAYDIMLKKLKKNYPQSEIWCCTLNKTFTSQSPHFVFPEKHGGTHIEEYNGIIRKVTHYNNCKLIDLYGYNLPYDTIDGSHPNADGMKTLATLMIREIGGEEINKFLDCSASVENYDDILMPYASKHEFVIADEYTGGTKFVCKKCGKVKHKSTLYPDYKEIDNAVTVELGLNKKYAYNEYSNQQQPNFVGEVLYGRYSVLEQIPSGGFFKLYLVSDIKTTKKMLLKLCDKSQKGYTDNIREIILQEPRMMMKLNHPAIPRISDIIEDDRYIAIIRDYLEGVPLNVVIQKYGHLTVDEVIKWGKQLCGVLSYLHNLNPSHIHRDIKPQNIILTPEGNLKLIDFGIMRMYNPQKSGDTTNLGTMGYAAPEQYGGLGQTDARTDIFGLGMTLRELLTGENPKNQYYVHRPICQVNPSLPKGLEYIISKCTERDPKNRYQSCIELIDDLNNYMSLPKSKAFFGMFM